MYDIDFLRVSSVEESEDWLPTLTRICLLVGILSFVIYAAGLTWIGWRSQDVLAALVDREANLAYQEGSVGRALEGRLSVVAARAHRSLWAPFLTELTSAFPDGHDLESIDYNREVGEVLISARIVRGTETPEGLLESLSGLQFVHEDFPFGTIENREDDRYQIRLSGRMASR